jgi:hypothetical protein
MTVLSPTVTERARQLAADAYLAVNAADAEALLAEHTLPQPDEAALATAFLLVHVEGDVTAAHRMLLRAPGTEEALSLLALEAYQTGQWDEAWQLAGTAADLCAARGYQLLHHQAQTVRAFVAASRGDTGTAQTLADEIIRWARPRGITHLLAGAHHAYALAAITQSDFQTAYRQATMISPVGCIRPHEPFATLALLDLTEAALRTGRRHDAAAHVQTVNQAGLATMSSRTALLTAAASAMTAPDSQAAALFDQALAIEDAGRWPFDRARVDLLFGERLRRMRR